MKRLAIVLVLLFVACGDPPPKEGRVIDRTYERAHYEQRAHTEYRTEYYTTSECTNDYDYASKSYRQSCRPVTRSRQEPYTVWRDEWIPDDYDLVLEVCSEDKCKERTVDVREHVYRQCKVGDYWREKTACRRM